MTSSYFTLAAADPTTTVALLAVAVFVVLLFAFAHFRRESMLAVDLALFLLRVPLGIVFLVAGWNKFSGGIGNFVSMAGGAVPPWMPPALGRADLYCVAPAEVLVGICLVLGLLTRPIGLLASLMLISFTIAATGITEPNKPFHTNLFYLAVAIAIMVIGAGRLSIDAVLPYPTRKKK